MKKLNIELNVRRMEAQNILTTSTGYAPQIENSHEGAGTRTADAATRTATPMPSTFRN